MGNCNGIPTYFDYEIRGFKNLLVGILDSLFRIQKNEQRERIKIFTSESRSKCGFNKFIDLDADNIEANSNSKEFQDDKINFKCLCQKNRKHRR